MISSFPPIINSESELLILGTMPGNASLEKQEYYAFKQNHFWRILYTMLDALPVSDVFYDKANFLLQNKIALWDVLQFCERKGSLDIHIKNHNENDFDALLKAYPKIKKIVFNGKESHRYFSKRYGQIEGITYFVMPSTSPANTIGFEKKYAAWSEILKYL